MPSIIFKLLLFLSSYFPLTLIVFVLFVEKHLLPSWVVLAVGALGLVGLLIYLRTVQGVAPTTVQVASVQRRDGEAMSYIVTYVIPFLAIPLGDWKQSIALGIFFVMLAVLYVNSDMIHVNPMLNLFGYHLYEITDKQGDLYAVLTKKRIRRDENISVITIGDAILVEKKDG